jgi:hypothetical protein
MKFTARRWFASMSAREGCLCDLSSIANGCQNAIRVLSTDKEVIPARNAIGAHA